jgi:peptide-methionine (R)-S-oxide reductase
MDDEQLQQKIMHEGGTEAPFTGKYWDSTETGKYYCRSCGQLLFDSSTKLDSSKGPIGLQGWPAFSEAVKDAISYKEDMSHGMVRTEAVCSNCGIHLGHVFDNVEGHDTKHYCINSCTLDFNTNKTD